MIIQHNIPALNAHRQLGINNTSLQKNLEKLSSGYRINRAADDAAGLAISEKMRAQITGLNRAALNAQDGASLIQTAEGALTEVHSMLNRMVELGTQAANGTIQASDRQKIEAEVTALKDEIDRISQATDFNGIQLLDGSLGAKDVSNISTTNLTSVAANSSAATKGSYDLTFANGAVTAGSTVSYTLTSSDGGAYNIDFTVSSDASKLIAKDGTEYALGTAGTGAAKELAGAVAGEASKIGGLTSQFTITNDNAWKLTFTSKEGGSGGAKITAAGGSLANPALTATAPKDATKAFTLTSYTGGNLDSATFTVNGMKFVAADAANAKLINDPSINVIQVSNSTLTAADYSSVAQQISAKTGMKVDNVLQAGGAGVANLVFHSEDSKGLTMQVGVTSSSFDQITVKVDDMSSTGLGLRNVSMATQESASASLDQVRAALEKVSTNRGNLGALQNRLEHTINNLNVASENMTAAESRIRDVDMAKEMMAFTKNNVLAQAAQSMLAQANQQPQQVLQLLR